MDFIHPDTWRPIRQLVLDAIPKSGEGITYRALLRAVCMETSDLNRVVATLREEGVVTVIHNGGAHLVQTETTT